MGLFMNEFAASAELNRTEILFLSKFFTTSFTTEVNLFLYKNWPNCIARRVVPEVSSVTSRPPE